MERFIALGFFGSILNPLPLVCLIWPVAHHLFDNFPEREKYLGIMDLLGSECSSGCESGWTLYLEQSFLSHGGSDRMVGGEGGFCDGYWKAKASEEEEEEEVEDLSMVSDASSGPPHFIEDDACSHEEDGHFSRASKSATLGKRKGKKQKIKEYQFHEPSSSFLDDTASSPALNFTPVSLRNNLF